MAEVWNGRHSGVWCWLERKRERGECGVLHAEWDEAWYVIFIVHARRRYWIEGILADFLVMNRTELTDLAKESISCGGIAVERGDGACEFWGTGFSV